MEVKTIVDDYLYSSQLDLDKSELKRSSIEIHDFVVRCFSDDNNKPIEGDKEKLMSTALYDHYNFLLYPLPQVWGLYHGIKESFRSLVSEGEYFIQCWVNVYKENDHIPWHGHFDDMKGCWHGYYCLAGEESVTSYKIPSVEHQVDVLNKEGQLIIGKSEGDLHRTYPWYGDEDRITIAFDIVPTMKIKQGTNHWMPI